MPIGATPAPSASQSRIAASRRCNAGPYRRVAPVGSGESSYDTPSSSATSPGQLALGNSPGVGSSHPGGTAPIVPWAVSGRVGSPHPSPMLPGGVGSPHLAGLGAPPGLQHPADFPAGLIQNNLHVEHTSNVDVDMTHVNVDVLMSSQEVLQQLNITNVSVGVPTEAFVEASQAVFEARFIAGTVINEAQNFATAAAAEYSQVVASASDAMVRQHDAAALESASRDD